MESSNAFIVSGGDTGARSIVDRARQVIGGDYGYASVQDFVRTKISELEDTEQYTRRIYDDIDADPNNSDYVWVSSYYPGQIQHYDVATNTLVGNPINLPSNQCPSGKNPEAEGLRVDSYGNVWVADEECNAIDEYTTNGFWSSYSMSGVAPWFVSIDNTNQELWITLQYGGSNHIGDIQKMDMSDGFLHDEGLPPQGSTIAAQNPFGIDVDSSDTRVAVSFYNAGIVDVYNYGSSPPGWICGSGGIGDPWSTGGSYGIRAVPTNDYWIGLGSNGEVGDGYC